MSNVPVKLIFGSMTMAVTRRKVKIISGEISGRRRLLVLFAHCSLCLSPKANMAELEMREAIMPWFLTILNIKEFKSFYSLDLRVLEPVQSLSRPSLYAGIHLPWKNSGTSN